MEKINNYSDHTNFEFFYLYLIQQVRIIICKLVVFKYISVYFNIMIK
jgi:hypothetical protein